MSRLAGIEQRERDMQQQSASNGLRLIYCLAVLSAVLPFGMSGWVALTVGRSPLQSVPYIGWIVVLLLGAWRIYAVARFRGTLDSFVYGGVLKFLRGAGILCMTVGAGALILRLASKPLVMALVHQRSDDGIEFFVVGLFLALIGGVGSLGLVFFELSRLVGFERQGQSTEH